MELEPLDKGFTEMSLHFGFAEATILYFLAYTVQSPGVPFFVLAMMYIEFTRGMAVWSGVIDPGAGNMTPMMTL
jgi:hypothetical protein